MIGYEQLAASFQARHLEVRVSDAVTVDPAMAIGDALALLEEHNFDQAPIVDSGALLGYVLRSDMLTAPDASTVADLAHAIGPATLVSADAPVGSLLEWIEGSGLLFVLDGHNVSGFITVSDFNKQPARAYLYLLFASLETALADLARRRFAEDQLEALRLLPVRQMAAVTSRHDHDRARNTEADYLAYLDFAQLLRLVARDRQMRSLLGFSSRKKWDAIAGSLPELRNRVMHPARAILEAPEEIQRLRGYELAAKELLNRARRAAGAHE